MKRLPATLSLSTRAFAAVPGGLDAQSTVTARPRPRGSATGLGVPFVIWIACTSVLNQLVDTVYPRATRAAATSAGMGAYGSPSMTVP